MHFSIPDTREVNDGTMPSHTMFDVHINGVYHCSLRYSKLHSFHELLKREYGAQSLPTFPPKKILSLNCSQLKERRILLERYIQIVSQIPAIATGDTFNAFLNEAQQLSQSSDPEDVTLDIYLLNGNKLSVCVLSTEQADDILEAVANELGLPEDLVYYFGLFLVKKDEHADNTIVRKLQEFESPYISLKAANETAKHKIILRKAYWDTVYDDTLISDRVASNLLYTQAVNDVDRGWLMASKEQHKQLTSLQKKGSKKEYLSLCQSLKYYGYLHFLPCTINYPQEGCRAIIAVGNKELNFRIQMMDQVREASFKVTRMRCWRISHGNDDSPHSSATHIDDTYGTTSQYGSSVPLELSFQYLIAKDQLEWIDIISDQAILISMCLQSMVDELIRKKKGDRVKKPSDRSVRGMRRSLSKMNTKGRSDVFSKDPVKVERQASRENNPRSAENGKNGSTPASPNRQSNGNDLSFPVITSHSSQPNSVIENFGVVMDNDAFNEIGDDDL